MPRKTKDQIDELDKEKQIKKAKKSTGSQEPKTTKKATKSTSKKSVTKKDELKSTKKVTTKKSTSKKSTTKTKKALPKKESKKKVEIVEYYDLPYRYNQTIVKILAQSPTNLFIYWDISDKDRKEFEKTYGKDFFETTKPVLIVHNNTLNYSFEVEINDFANSWYLHVADAKCDYRIELGRRPFEKTEKIHEDYIYISSSNKIESPNNKILFNKDQKIVYFRDTKTGKETIRNIDSFEFIKNLSQFYTLSDALYNLYKSLYGNENVDEIYNLSNPSSGNPSSSTSSRF